LSDNHDLCVLDFINDVNARAKSKSVKKSSKKKVWKPTGKVFTNIGYIWRPTGRIFTIVENAFPLTRITTTTEVPLRKPTALKSDTPKPVVTLVYSRKPKKSKTNVPVSKHKIINSISANNKEPKVIVNGDAPAIALASAGTEGLILPKTNEQKLARKNELKVKSTLLLAIPDELESRMQRPYGKQSRLDANLKLLRSLPSAWNNIALIMRNKSDLDTLSMDDFYNNLKVYESEIKGQSSSSSNSQNVAFVSLENTSSTNEAVNTAHDVSTASSQGQAPSSTYADDVMFSFFANQSNSGHAYHEGEEILKEDRKESKFQWQRNCYQMGLESLEARIVVHEKNKVVYEEDIAFLKYDVQVKDISIKDLKNQLEEALKEKDDLKLKLENFEESSKNLTKLINSQISAKDKTGLGYDS
ncbi:hypothetical protein Tco_1250578, partial [Tanacetum coccineum]